MQAKTEQPEPIAVRQAEAARMLGVTTRTLRRWKVPHKRKGNVVMYPLSALRKLVGAKE